MRTRLFWMVALGLSLLLIGGSPALALAATGESKAPEASKTPAVTKAPAAPVEKEAKQTKAEKKEEAAEKAKETAKTEAAEKKPAGLVGTIVAFTPASRTLVVDVPLGKQVLRIGAWVTPRTKIMQGNKKASLANLKEGERVRLNFRRIATGDDAISVVILRADKV